MAEANHWSHRAANPYPAHPDWNHREETTSKETLDLDLIDYPGEWLLDLPIRCRDPTRSGPRRWRSWPMRAAGPPCRSHG